MHPRAITCTAGLAGALAFLAALAPAAAEPRRAKPGASAPPVAAPAQTPPSASVGPVATMRLGVAKSARFRLTALGFRVERQSYDTINEADGRGDEVYVRGDWMEFDAAGHQVANDTRRTALIGHLGRHHGGSGRAGLLDPSGDGGFVTGDSYPLATPWTPRARATAADDLPMVIWEGELVDGANAVVVVPTIWEWDAADADAEERRWQTGLPRAAVRDSARIASIISAWPAGQRTPLFTDLLSLFVTNDGNRPIGSSRRWTGAALGPISHTIPMEADPLILTWRSATDAAARVSTYSSRTEAGAIGRVVDMALPTGVFGVPMIDGQDMEGDYTLFLKLERLP